jgi:hypothetical protein
MTIAPNVPVVRMTYQAPVAEGKVLVFETYVPLDEEVKFYHAVADKLRAVADRQEAIVKVAIVEKQLKAERSHLEALASDERRLRDASVARWDGSGRKGDYKPTAAESQTIGNIESSTTGRKLNITILEDELKHYKALL